ncbi:MAG: DUF4131 domain-containing protein, partial [Candidatus Pacebacteria bacterium]|nr:DUF4131 domain-containing protein [Candidatus Paceibacterota bacterium]
MKQNSLYIFIGGFVAGILFRSFVNLGFSFSIFLIALSGAIFLATLREARRVSIAFFILAAGFGVLRFDIADLNKGNIVLDEVVRQEIIAEGILVDEPDERENHTKLIILLDTILVPTKSAVEDKIIVTADIHPRFSYGDKLRIKGELKKPKNFAGDDG